MSRNEFTETRSTRAETASKFLSNDDIFVSILVTPLGGTSDSRAKFVFLCQKLSFHLISFQLFVNIQYTQRNVCKSF